MRLDQPLLDERIEACGYLGMREGFGELEHLYHARHDALSIKLAVAELENHRSCFIQVMQAIPLTLIDHISIRNLVYLQIVRLRKDFRHRTSCCCARLHL